MSGREAVTLVARREIVERAREKSFQISTLVGVVIIVLVVVIASLIGGGDTRYVVGHTDAEGAAVAEAAATAARGSDVEIEPRAVDDAQARAGLEDGSLDAVVAGGRIRSQEEPEDELVTLLQAANRQVRAATALEQAGVSGNEAREVLAPPPLRVSTVEAVDEDDDAKSTLTFFIVIILYGQILTYGFWVSTGVVEL